MSYKPFQLYISITMKHSLNWRYATKQYDSTKKLTEEQVTDVIEAINYAPTAYGLQPFRIIHVKTEGLRAKLREAAYGQPQVTDASDILVLVAHRAVKSEHINDYMDRIVEVRGMERGMLTGFSDHIQGAVAKMNEDQMTAWNARQAYIGLGFGLAMAAHLGIDSSPMEGFNPQAVNEALGLTEDTAVVLLALGYRSEADTAQHYKKVRKSLEQFVEVK